MLPCASICSRIISEDTLTPINSELIKDDFGLCTLLNRFLPSQHCPPLLGVQLVDLPSRMGFVHNDVPFQRQMVIDNSRWIATVDISNDVPFCLSSVNPYNAIFSTHKQVLGIESEQQHLLSNIYRQRLFKCATAVVYADSWSCAEEKILIVLLLIQYSFELLFPHLDKESWSPPVHLYRLPHLILQVPQQRCPLETSSVLIKQSLVLFNICWLLRFLWSVLPSKGNHPHRVVLLVCVWQIMLLSCFCFG